MERDIIESAVEAIYGQLEMLRSSLGGRVSDIEVRQVAERFAQMDDDAQAKFFVKVARIMDSWPKPSHGRDGQAWYIGRHLATCACSTQSARDLIAMIHQATTDAMRTCDRS